MMDDELDPETILPAEDEEELEEEGLDDEEVSEEDEEDPTLI
ncbi:MAG: hypothetical protein V4644_02110 [Patescibacteria group bacterium]